MKLNAPQIDGNLQAFSGDELIINFDNDIILSSFTEIRGLQILIKDLYNTIVGVFFSNNFSLTEGWVKFNLINDNVDTSIQKNLLKPGFFYKIQLAYRDEETDTLGYYSSVGIIKYTFQPDVFILGLNKSKINSLVSVFVGSYSNSQDKSEKLYSSYFIIKDSFGNIKQQTAEKIHNSSEDANEEQIEKITLNFNFSQNDIYTIQFITKSVNGLVSHSPEYQLTKEFVLFNSINIGLNIVNNIEEAYNEVSLTSANNELLSGLFVLSRIQKDTQERMILKYLNVSFFNPSDWVYRDYLIENGKTYYYTFAQYNNKGVFSSEIKSNEVMVRYEHIFLYDSQQQMTVKYNPKVQSFKENVLEAKIDTLGNKYPFVFRGGNVQYKEFSIAGLLKNEQYGFYGYAPYQDPFDENNKMVDPYEVEKEWKIQSLEWLNNGEIKLFKSPAEGIYLVRLTDISLSPEEQLGRWLHSFSATAYEIAETNRENYLKYSFLTEQEEQHISYNYQSIDLSSVFINPALNNPLDNIPVNGNNTMYDLQVIDMLPGSYFYIQQQGQSFFEKIVIGNTGSYSIKNIPIQKFVLTQKQQTGILSFKCLHEINSFGEIEDIETFFYMVSLFGDFNFNTTEGFSNIYFIKPNNKYLIQSLRFLFFEKRDLVITDSLPPAQEKCDPLKIYFTPPNGNVTFTSGQLKTNNIKNYLTIDKDAKQIIDNFYKIKIKYKNKQEVEIIDIENKTYFKINNIALADIEEIEIGLGIKIDIGFYLKEQIYSEEKLNTNIETAKLDFLQNPTEEKYKKYIDLFA